MIAKKLREKKGNILMLAPFIIVFAMMFLMLLLNYGLLFLSKNQSQAIADAASRAGAYMGAVNGKYAEDLRTGEVRVILDESSCKNYANKIIDANNIILASETHQRDNITSKKYNPSGEMIEFELNGVTYRKSLSTKKQYYAGAFTVVLNTKHKKLLPNGFLSSYNTGDTNIEVKATTIITGKKK